MNRRRVLTVLDAPECGGIASHLTSSLGRISRSRFDLRVANLGRSTPLSDRLRAMKVRVHDLDVEGAFALPRRVLALRRLIRGTGIDLVHSCGRTGAVARLAAGGIPVVSTLPDPDGAAGLRARLRDLAERRTLPRAARLLACDETTRRRYEDGWGVTAEVIPRFLDVPTFRDRLAETPRLQARIRLGIAAEDVVLLDTDASGPGRALDLLIEAFRVARVEHPPLRLFLAGEGAATAEARVLAGSLGLADGVVFLGAVDDPAPLYAAADVFLASGARAGRGMAWLEAMAAGLPGIAVGGAALPGAATPESALLAAADRPEALARCLLQVAADPERRARMGHAAAARANELDVAVWVPRLEKLYADVMRTRGTR